jgi:hypothetical protein
MTQKDKDMNYTQLKQLLSMAVTAGMSYVAGKGWLPQDTASELAAWIVAGIPIAISVWSARDKGKIAAAAQVEGVKIVAPDPIANSLPANVLPESSHDITPKQ